MREVIGVAMEKEKASLRCNSDTDFIRDFQTVAAFKTLFGKKNLDVAKKLGLIPRGQSVKKYNMALNQRQPLFRKRPRPQATSPSLLQQLKDHMKILAESFMGFASVDALRY